MSTHNDAGNGDAPFDDARTADHLPTRSCRDEGTVADGVLTVHDTRNALAWIELELPSEHAVFDLRTVR